MRYALFRKTKGVALIFAYMVIAALSGLSAAFMLGSASEASIARQYTNSMSSFWIAESGLAQAYYNWAHNQRLPAGDISFGGGVYNVDSSGFPLVTATGSFGGSQRKVQAFFVRVPLAFDNTISVGGDMQLKGALARVEVYGKTRISGSYSRTPGTSGWFENKQEGVSTKNTTIKIPDYNGNGTSDEFADFVLFGQKAVQGYPADETVYIKTNGTVNIFPDEELVGKRVIFVEGDGAGKGHVNIFFDGTWQEGEDLTVISTGTISYMEPLQYQTDARLSCVSWGKYNEAAVFRSEHVSALFAHDDADFIDILDWGSTTGNVVTNNDLSLKEVLTYEKYYYSQKIKDGDLPPGFQWLAGSTGTNRMLDWQEAV